ncbi:MAG: TonB-dependent receptor [Pirellulales bacterium]|nr:TonB-dependent receptor [Pirellulales bacterium]
MARFYQHCSQATNLCLITITLLAILGVSGSVLSQDVPDPRNSPTTTNKPSNSLASSNAEKLDALLDLAEKDVGQLAEISIASPDFDGASSSPSSTLNAEEADFAQATSTGDLLKQIPSVSGRRLSGINVDPRVRGYNSSQLNANANGMTQYKSIQDVDSLLSQIDPGVIQEVDIIAGPYTSLYGPGFAFININLLEPKRYDRPEIHSSTFFNYASNGQIMYARENVWGGSKDWGMYCTYGVRTGNDYHAGGDQYDFTIPTSFKKWDTMLSLSYDLNSISRIEFDFLHNELNDVEMPGIIYDPENSSNNQFNLRYIIQEDRKGPQDLLLQAWHEETFFHGDASRESKQRTFYVPFVSLVYWDYGYDVSNCFTRGHSISTGVRALRTFGAADAPRWTVGADWRRSGQRYQEIEVDPNGEVTFRGNYYGIPESSLDDVGALMQLELPLNDRLSATVGGRVDYVQASLNREDSIIWHFDPDAFVFYQPGLEMPNYVLGMAYINAKQKLNDTDTLHVGTGFAMRAPNLGELYFDEPLVPYCNVGNSELNGLSILKPEKNWQFDVGVTCERKPLRYGARGFYSTIWDYILSVPAWTDGPYDCSHDLHRDFQYWDPDFRGDLGYLSENGDTVVASYQNENIRLAMMWGCDLFGELEIRRGVSLFGCVSYIQGRNLSRIRYIDAGEFSALEGYTQKIPGSESLPNIYPLNGWISLKVFDPEKDKWRIEFITRLVNAQNEVAVSLSELPTPGFVIFNLRGSYRWSERLNLTLALENLTNAYYFEPGSVVILNPSGIPVRIPEPGFTVSLGIEGKF